MSDYSLNDPLVLNVASRRAQAAKILRVVSHFARQQAIDIAAMRCLDIGCSSGVITRALGQSCAHVVGIDVDWSALALSPFSFAGTAAARSGQSSFIAASGLALPFADTSFDTVVCNQVYQYVPDVPRLLAEIRRVLRAGAFCFFSARNLWGIAASENWLPLIASISQRAAQVVARVIKPQHNWRHRAGTLRPFASLRRLAERNFIVHDYTTCVLADPSLSDLFVPARSREWLQRAPHRLLALLKPIMPTHLWILQKPTYP